MSDAASPGDPSRRRFLLQISSPIALALVGLPSREAEAAVRERSVVLDHCHTGESLRAVYYADGRYQREGLRAAAHILRDWRQGRAHAVDPELLDLLWALRRRLEATAPIQVLCGYRTPATNAMLRRRSRGVAKNSLHMQGMAVDFTVPGRSLKAVRQAALSLRRGGVGYYPRSGFVHVDTGPVRAW
jgi:uncharacterized protein YcbK (DUF882 family)